MTTAAGEYEDEIGRARDAFRSLSRLPSGLIFMVWGTLLVAIDFDFVNGALRFDIFNDVIGFALVFFGLRGVIAATEGSRGESALRFAELVAGLSILMALVEFYNGPRSGAVDLVLHAWLVLQIVAMIRFMGAMMTIGEELQLAGDPDAWKRARALYIAAYVVPLALLTAAVWVRTIAGGVGGAEGALWGVFVVAFVASTLIAHLVFLVRLAKTAGLVRRQYKL